MRQKIISLSLDTYELASKKANFSAWVRRKLMEEVKESEKEYGAYCSPCDMTFSNPFASKMFKFLCPKCANMTEFLGELE
jgi:hypothetical protein